MSDPDVRPEDAVQIAQRALAKVNELERENEALRERVTELEASQPDRGDYYDLDRPTKVGLVREHLHKRAKKQRGRAAIDYDDVKWEVFDGEPSADHCYTLMELAAKADGFGIREPSNGNRELTVNLDSTNPEHGFSHANKDIAEGGR